MAARVKQLEGGRLEELKVPEEAAMVVEARASLDATHRG